MKIRYDKTIDAMYIPLKKGVYSHSKKVTNEIIVDVSKADKVLGIEILDASKTISNFQPRHVTWSQTPSRTPTYL